MKFLKTFELAHAIDPTLTEDEFNQSSRDNRRCSVCAQHVWRYAGTGLCFTCTTGEADSSDDYEIGESY
jgi:hypothetical protein